MLKTRDKFYVEDHRLAFWFSLGSLVIGALIAAAPGLSEGSSAFALLPTWAVTVWGLFYAFGGGLSLLGLRRGSPRMESAGMALLAGALFVSIVTTLSYRGPGAALSVGYLAFLVIGCGHRSFNLANDRGVDQAKVDQIIRELRDAK